MRTLSFLLLGTALIACQPQNSSSNTDAPAATTAATDQSESERLNAWFDATFMENAREYPQYLARLGIKERMDEWNDPSPEFYAKQLAETKAQLAELRSSFDFEALGDNEQLSYRLWETNAERSLDGEAWNDHGYTFHQMYGPHKDLVTFLVNQHKIDTKADAEAYVARLSKIDDYLGQHIENSKRSFEKGIAPPKFVYGYIIGDAENILKGAPFEDTDELNLFLSDFEKKVEKLDLAEAEKEALYEQAITALKNDVAPVYADFITEMRRQEAEATTEDGVWKLPNGDEYYEYRLRMMTTTDMTPDEIHDLGLSEVARIHAEMKDIMKEVEFEGDLQDFFEFTRTDKQFYYPETAEGKARYLKEATDLIDIMETRIPEAFNLAPKAPMEVRAVEAFREKSAGKAFYSAPAPDGSRPGYYYANLYSMADMPIYQMEALAYHEGIPGHHMQIAISQELEGIPQFRKYGRFTAYSEGWGLYSEFLPKEMGFYEDPYSDFGRLAMELWRAARLVVDTGLHHKKWTREEAIKYLTDNTPNPEGDCIKAIERYIVMPGQATAYKIGMNKIVELREQAKAELGDAFDLGDYHDVILASGPVPLNIMEENVEQYIARVKG
ncbi:DUF885 domain-containing protein [Litorimonas sp. RW-G-Af-16]|uniref:DUF885 domain-containing protein n=1 Tax=Litorimonas sp. RW-G-Af-16 TaxID=3241168 RepID=UPI00390C946F